LDRKAHNQEVRLMIFGDPIADHDNKTSAELNFGFESIAKSEFSQRAVSSGGKGRQSESRCSGEGIKILT